MTDKTDMPEGITRDDTVHGETYFTAADMATASAQGFRDGVASLSAAEPVPAALQPVMDGCLDAWKCERCHGKGWHWQSESVNHGKAIGVESVDLKTHCDACEGVGWCGPDAERAAPAQPATTVTEADIEVAREFLADVHNATQMRSALGQLRRDVVIELAARGIVPDYYGASTPSPQAAQQATAGAADWWRPHASKIEDRVAASGSTAAMACFTDMRTLLQAATEPVAAPAAPSTPASGGATDWLNADDMAALQRADECFEDGEGHDLQKARVDRLIELGVFRHNGGGYYSITSFGSFVLGCEHRHLPLETSSECNERLGREHKERRLMDKSAPPTSSADSRKGE